MCCQIMSVVFGKGLYLIPKKKAHNDLKEEEGRLFEKFLSFPFTIIENLELKIGRNKEIRKGILKSQYLTFKMCPSRHSY